MQNLRIVYLGTPDFAVESLRRIHEGGYNIVGVITMPDKPAGRGHKLLHSPVKQYAVANNLPLLQPVNLKDPQFVEELRGLGANLFVVIAFRMLPEVVWAMPRLGTFNLHASLLPEYRGAAPINWAIINGEKRTGVTTFLLNHEIDKGAIIAQHTEPILAEDNIGTMYDKLMTKGCDLVVDTVEKIASGDFTAIEQMHIDEATLKPAPKIFKDDCRIDWSWKGERIVNFVRGLSPYPAAWSPMFVEGEERGSAKIFEVKFEPKQHSFEAGKIFSDGKESISVSCADGIIHIHSMQLAGKKRMSNHDLLLGFRDIESYTFR